MNRQTSTVSNAYSEYLPQALLCGDESKAKDVLAQLGETWKGLREEVRRTHVGEFVALGQGGVLATAPTFDEAMAAVQALQPAPACCLIFEADEEPVFHGVTRGGA